MIHNDPTVGLQSGAVDPWFDCNLILQGGYTVIADGRYGCSLPGAFHAAVRPVAL